MLIGRLHLPERSHSSKPPIRVKKGYLDLIKLPPLLSGHFRISCSRPLDCGSIVSESSDRRPAAASQRKEVQIASFDRCMRPRQRSRASRQIKSLNRRPQREQRNAECFASLAAFCRGSVVHSLYSKAHALSRKVIGAAIEVHRLKGSGLIEGIYEKCLVRELDLRSISCICQRYINYQPSTFPAPGPL